MLGRHSCNVFSTAWLICIGSRKSCVMNSHSHCVRKAQTMWGDFWVFFGPHKHDFEWSFQRKKVAFQGQPMLSEQFLSTKFENRRLVQDTSYHWQTSSTCRENAYSFPKIGPFSTCLHWFHTLPAAVFWLHTLYPQALLQERVTQNMLFQRSLLLTRSLSSLLFLSYQT